MRRVVFAICLVLAACGGSKHESATGDLTKLPLGDSHVKHAPGVGNLDLCTTFPTNGPGAPGTPAWVHGDTFDLTAKSVVRGDVAWPNARFVAAIDGASRVLKGNNLPVGHTTGSFPIATDDPAYQADRNPSGIVEHDYTVSIPANPVAATTPGCVGGEAGFLTSGVILNSPVDAQGRDAVAHEAQDRCGGHPNNAGYHMHSVSTCVDKASGRHALVGYALDGFGVFGRYDADGKLITNADLDTCHGHSHDIQWDGKSVTMYHYHATNEFPYAVGCFHGIYTARGPVLGAPH